MKDAPNSTLILYPRWDRHIPAPPLRSRLYHLTPLGVGTPAVESLSSFLLRLAAAHCVEMGTLFAQEIALLLNDPYLLKSPMEPIPYALQLVKQIYSVNGLGPALPRWVRAVETLTGQTQLQPLTMLPWERLLTPRALLRKTRVWCPDCLADSQTKNEPVYERLAWTLQTVTACPVHERRLSEVCPFCGGSSPVLTVRAQAGYCFRCTQWLGTARPSAPADSAPVEQVPHSALVRASLVGELLATPTHVLPPLSSRHFADLLDQYARQVTSGNVAAFARFLGFDYLMTRALRYGANRPMLHVLITLLERLELSVPEFFSGQPTRIALPDQREYHMPDRLAAAQALMQTAATDPSCPSVNELSRRLGYKNAGNFRQANPELCKEIVERNRRVRSYDPLAHKSLHDEPVLREKLSAALLINPAPALKQIAEELGYKAISSLRVRCPDLYQALRQRRNLYLQERKAALAEALQAVLQEEPPPTLRAVTQRLEMKNESAIVYQFPDLAKAITERHRAYLRTRKENIRRALEAALTAVPPLSVRQIARNTQASLTRIYRYFPDLCRQVAARRIEYLHQRSLGRKERVKAEIKQIVTELAGQGIFPSLKQMFQAGLSANILREDWACTYYEALLREIPPVKKVK